MKHDKAIETADALGADRIVDVLDDTHFPPDPLTPDQWALARVTGRWVPETLTTAEWTAQRLSEVTAELDEIKGQVAEYTERVEAWADDLLHSGRGAELARYVEMFEAGLKVYARRARAESGLDHKGEPKVKTVLLPSATLETRKPVERKPKFVVTDMDALLEWAKEGAPDAIYVDISKLKLLVIGDDEQTVVTADGEHVPGVDFMRDDEPREPTVMIRLKS